jgi:hypothetical protein
LVSVKGLVLVLVLSLVLVACGGDDEGTDVAAVSVADATTCEQLVDAFMPLMQEVLDAVSDMTMGELTSGDPPEVLDDFEERMEEIGAKSDDLNCDDDEVSEMLASRAGELEASGPVGELLLEIITEGNFE